MLITRRPLCALFLAVLAVLICRYTFAASGDADPYAAFDKQTVTFSGCVKQKTQRKTRDGETETTYVLFADGVIRPDGSFAKTAVSMSVYPESDTDVPKTGERIRVRGTVSCFAFATNPGEFDARRYYATRGIRFRLYDARIEKRTGKGSAFRETLYALRVKLGGAIDSCLTAEDAGIMRSMLLGDNTSMDAETKNLYRSAGIAHLLAVSGLHFSIAGGCVHRLLKILRLPQGICAVTAMFLMASYALLCGMPASALRAACMFALALVAPRLKRSYDLLSAMALAGLLMLAEQPLYARDSGFLLSFLAVSGIGVLLPVLKRCTDKLPGVADGSARGGIRKGPFAEISVRRGIRNGLLAGISVTLTTLPVLLCSYGTFSVYAVFLNLVVVPLMSVVLPLGFLVMLPGLLSPVAGSLFAVPLHGLLLFYRHVCLGSRHLPFHTWYAGHPEAWQVALYYALLAGGVVLAERAVPGKRAAFAAGAVRANARGKKPAIAWTVAVLLGALTVLTVRRPPALQITALDVGQGDSIVIRHGGRCYLVDCGSTSADSVGTYRLVPYLKHEGIGVVDAVFVSHEDEDHVNGVLELFDEMKGGGIRIGRLVLPDVERKEAVKTLYAELVHRSYAAGVPVSFIAEGERMARGDLVFTCFGPVRGGSAAASESANAHSMILHMEYAAFSALFTGDVEAEGLSELNGVLSGLPPSMRRVDLLKVAHHGSRFTTDDAFLTLVDAELALISCGRNNRYGHPHAELLERLSEDGMEILTTADHGAVTVTVPRCGAPAKVKTFCPPEPGPMSGR